MEYSWAICSYPHSNHFHYWYYGVLFEGKSLSGRNVFIVIFTCAMIGIGLAFLFYQLDANNMLLYHLTDQGVAIEEIMTITIIAWSLIGVVIGVIVK